MTNVEFEKKLKELKTKADSGDPNAMNLYAQEL